MDGEERANLHQRIGQLKAQIERMELSRHEAGLDDIALNVAHQVEDLFAQHHNGGRTQRLARIQLIVREAMRANLKGETDWRYPGNLQTIRKPQEGS